MGRAVYSPCCTVTCLDFMGGGRERGFLTLQITAGERGVPYARWSTVTSGERESVPRLVNTAALIMIPRFSPSAACGCGAPVKLSIFWRASGGPRIPPHETTSRARCHTSRSRVGRPEADAGPDAPHVSPHPGHGSSTGPARRDLRPDKIRPEAEHPAPAPPVSSARAPSLVHARAQSSARTRAQTVKETKEARVITLGSPC